MTTPEFTGPNDAPDEPDALDALDALDDGDPLDEDEPVDEGKTLDEGEEESPSQAPPVSGAELLDQVRAAMSRYVVLPSPEALDAVVLWIAATHAQPSWACAPRLVIRAPEKRCGKSRLLDLIEAVVHNPLITVNASPAAVYRSIGTNDPPTILLDEADTIFGPKAGDSNEELRGLLNAGHQRNRNALRYNAATNSVEHIPTFAMAALAGIGVMPDTIEDRAVVVRMRRRAPGENVDPFRHKRDAPAFRVLARQLHKWARANSKAFEAAAPAMPLEDRAADTWEPLFSIAAHAGRDWPERARAAALALTADHDASTEEPFSVRLLADCRTAFGPAEVLPTEDLLERLKEDPESPWPTWGGRGDGLTAMKLGVMLREYDIRSTKMRLPDVGQVRGYLREDFTDAWDRYCPSPTEGDAASAGLDDGHEGRGKPPQPQPASPAAPRCPTTTAPVLTLCAGPHDPADASPPARPGSATSGPARPGGHHQHPAPDQAALQRPRGNGNSLDESQHHVRSPADQPSALCQGGQLTSYPGTCH